MEQLWLQMPRTGGDKRSPKGRISRKETLAQGTRITRVCTKWSFPFPTVISSVWEFQGYLDETGERGGPGMTRNGPGREEFQARRDSESLLSLCVEAKCRDTVDLALRLEDLLLIVRGSLEGCDEEEMCLRWEESGV